MDHLFRQRWISLPKCTRNLVALFAVSCALFLFLQRDLSTQLNDDVTAFNHFTDRILTERTDLAERSMLEYKVEIHAAPVRRRRNLANAAPRDLQKRSKLQRTLEAKPDDTQEESWHQILEEALLPEPWELNNTARAGMDLLFFNRVPKVGSLTVMNLILRLSKKNQFDFLFEPSQRMEKVHMEAAEQIGLASDLSALALPVAYAKHVGYINFTRYGFPSPIYMNLVRDPVERVISWFYYVRDPRFHEDRKRMFPGLPPPNPVWLKKDFETCVRSGDSECCYVEGGSSDEGRDHRRQTLFFCGHDTECIPFNTLEAMQRAKRVVEQQYAVVGVLEDMNSTLLALERYIPRFFRGASRLYWENRDNIIYNQNFFKPAVSEAVKQIVRANFTREIEFYEFCKQRLHMQLKALRDPSVTLPMSRRVKRRAMKQSRRLFG